MQSLIAFVFGSIVGSFLNVCIFRIPNNQSIVFPGSACFACKKPIRWYDNIPILSFFILRGRCRDCHGKISPQYVWIEALSGGLFVLFYQVFGLTAMGLIYLILSLVLLVESAIDFRHEIIPDCLTLPGLVIGIVLSGFFPALHGTLDWQWGLLWSVVGFLVGGGFLYATASLTELLMKKEAMGGGDIKLMAMVGAILGWQGALWAIFVASVLGSVIGIYLRLKKGQERIPFGPYLGLGSFLYIFFGSFSIALYTHGMGWKG